jgi:hypothetical protein
MTVLKLLKEIAEASPPAQRRFGTPQAVAESDDLSRILALPRRAPPARG